ncbi:hypothetical protein F4809DRAFT_656382 [Biscogniauxia mediterranea]|nr:hypothetical protein F4809DRAFT_656382 [Biscogniauxia mediterranea]
MASTLISAILTFFVALFLFLWALVHSFPGSHSEPEPLTEFHYFVSLPPEIQIAIWEWHFRPMLRPKIHRITSTKQLGSLSLPFGFVVDSYPVLQISPADRNITPESQLAARWVEQAYGTPVPILGAVADHVRKTYGGLTNSNPWVESLLLSKRLTSGPDRTRIHWASDLLYIELANGPLDILFGSYKSRDYRPGPSWLANVQRLAIYFDRKSLTSISSP